MAYNLNDRALLGIEGEDAKSFLQSVITNDINILDEQKAIYAAHLTPKGKFLFDFFISKLNGMYVIDCHKDELMPLAKSFHGYVVSKNIEFNDLTADYKCIASKEVIEQNTLSYTDPRTEKMGIRNWIKKLPKNLNSLEEYNEKRIKLGIIDGAYDGLKERSLINEMGLEGLNGISFEKGCYVGQELTARTKFRTEPKKKVFKIQFSGTAQNGDSIKCEKMEAGWVFSNINNIGIAIIKTRYLDKEMTLNNKVIQILP